MHFLKSKRRVLVGTDRKLQDAYADECGEERVENAAKKNVANRYRRF